MTHKATLPSPGSSATQSNSAHFLADAIVDHCSHEKASFHTPGHKGRPAGGGAFAQAQEIFTFDVTELPLTDELSCPSAVLFELEKRIAALWHARHSLLSVNGASGALIAAVLACTPSKQKLLIPRNCHRSIIQALVLSGLEPIWYEPNWSSCWGFWTDVNPASFSAALFEHGQQLAAAVVVSPTYAGDTSNIEQLSNLCRQASVPLIVDEAHGAHMASTGTRTGLAAGADLVVHSLHKTLGALTQTAILHIGTGAQIETGAVRSALNLLLTSSPSYLLLTSIDETIRQMEADGSLSLQTKISELNLQLLKLLAPARGVETYVSAGGSDPAHIVLRIKGLPAKDLFLQLCQKGIYPEAVLGSGVLLLLGQGSTACDIEFLAAVLEQLESPVARTYWPTILPPPPAAPQILTPRQAAFEPSEMLPVAAAIGRIAADCFAPCPPGTPVLVPGQAIPPEILSFSCPPALRVVIESPIQGEN